MKYEHYTEPAPEVGYYAKVMTIPRLSTVNINSFNMIFEVYYISAWRTPIIEKYGLSLTDTGVRLTKFPQLGISENNLLDNVGYVVNNEDVDIYVKSNVKYACVYINVLGVTPTDISIKHDYAKFVSTEPDNIVYATTKSSYIDNIKALESKLSRTLGGSVWHSSTTANIILPESNRSYFGIISDNHETIAFVNISLSGNVYIRNIGEKELSATYNNSTRTLTVSGLGTQKFLHYILAYSY